MQCGCGLACVCTDMEVLGGRARGVMSKHGTPDFCLTHLHLCAHFLSLSQKADLVCGHEQSKMKSSEQAGKLQSFDKGTKVQAKIKIPHIFLVLVDCVLRASFWQHC